MWPPRLTSRYILPDAHCGLSLDARAASDLERVSGDVRRLRNAQREDAAGRLLGL